MAFAPCYVSPVIKPNITTKRVQEIEKLQEQLRKLAAEYKQDFTDPNALDSVIEKICSLL